jgi:dTDP-4-dehydrorhamnose 3,5-epimerase
MPIIVTPTSIPDVLIIEPKVYGDDRGYFYEAFNENNFLQAIGKKVTFVQDNHSLSKKGVLRGLHYQLQEAQGKLVRVCRGAVFDVAVDLRQSSGTFGQWVGVNLSSDNKKQLWIPEGFAHGFLTLSDEAEFLYKTTNYFQAPSEQCIAWNDSKLNIQWPKIGIAPILNSKDMQGVSWNQAPKIIK